MDNVKRRFSLEKDFMNYKVDDILYGFMRSLSTAKPVYENGKPKLNENKKQVYKEYLTLKAICKQYY